MKRINVWLDEQARENAAIIAKAYGVRGVGAAIRLALQEVAKRIIKEQEGKSE